MKKRISILIILAMLAAECVSCGDSGKIVDDDSDAVSSSEDSVDMSSVSELPDKKWGGKEFRVLGSEDPAGHPQFDNFEIYAESENGDLVNDAVFRRNRRIEEKYEVSITQTLVADPSGDLKKSVMSQEDLYDLAFSNVWSVGSLSAEGFVYDMNTVEYIDFSKNYWNQEVNEALTIGNSLYFTSSDFSLRDKNRVYIMVYNRDMLEKYSLGSIVDKVRDGTWTAEAMEEYAKAVTYDVNSDGKMSVEDNFGVGFDSYNGFMALMYGFGSKIVQNNNGTPEIVMNSEKTISGIDKALAISKNGFYCNDFKGKVDYDFWSVSKNLFVNEQVMFTTSFPHGLAVYSELCDFDYGVCPFPKYDEEQEKYLSMADTQSMLFGIPVTTPTPEFSGFMLEALSEDSEEVLYNYYELTCKVKHTYDEDSAEMLDIIFDGIVYDLGNIYDIGLYYSVYESIARSGENNFASLYAANENSARSKLEEAVSSFN